MIILFLIVTFPLSILSICWPPTLQICSNETLLSNVSITTDEPIFISSMMIVSKSEINIISSTNITFVNLTIIMLYLNIESPLIIIKDSQLSSNASIALGLGHNPSNLQQQGNAYAAIGSMCVRWGGVEDLTYGRNCWTVNESRLEKRERMRGSGGENEKEYGGGTIIIYAINALYLSNVTITSSGAPFPSSSSPCTSSADFLISSIVFGGSGGLILIQTTFLLPFSNLPISILLFLSSLLPSSSLPHSPLSTQPLSNRLLVEGGGYCLNGQGGSGGRINIVSQNTTKEIENFFEFSTKGGGSLDGSWELCSNGGSGTICFHTLTENEGGREESGMMMERGRSNKERLLEERKWRKEESGKREKKREEEGGKRKRRMVEEGREGRILKIDGKGFVTGTPTIISMEDSEEIDQVFVQNMGYLSVNSNLQANIRIKRIIFRDSFFEDFVQVKDNAPVAISIDEIFTQNSTLVFQRVVNLTMNSFYLSSNSFINISKTLMLTLNEFVVEGNITGLYSMGSSLKINVINKFEQAGSSFIKDIDHIFIFSHGYINIRGSISSFSWSCTFETGAYDNAFFTVFKKYIYQIEIFEKFLECQSKCRDIIGESFKVAIISKGEINIYENATVQGGRIIIFGTNLTLSLSSSISSSSLGCPSDSGPGKGQSIIHEENYCGGMGASHGGYKGYGLGNNNDESILCKSYAKQIDEKENNLPYGDPDLPVYEGSGGGSGNLNGKGGAGGGIILILLRSYLHLNGTVQANGQSVLSLCRSNEGPGAGSGGSIQIFCMKMKGTGSIQAKGGDSGSNCGEGGGGRVKVHFWGWEEVDREEGWKGGIEVGAGRREGGRSLTEFMGTNGTISVSPCLKGYYPNPLCTRCPEETYKDSIGGGYCKSCLTKPANSFYSRDEKDPKTDCNYTCNGGTFSKNGCQNAFFIYLNYIFGPYGYVCISVIMLIILIGYYYKKRCKSKKKILYESLFNLGRTTEKISNPKILSEDLKKEEKFSSFGDLLYHVHRINVNGTNTYDNRWFLNLEPPQEIDYFVHREKFGKFAEIFNRKAKWSKCLGIFLRIIAILYYPFYAFLVQRIRKKKYKELVEYIKMHELFWKIRDSDDLEMIKLKIGVSEDLTCCYLDIFNYRASSFRYFTLNTPFTVMLAGEGSFFKPFNLDFHDPFVKSLYFAINLIKNESLDIDDRTKINELLVSEEIQHENNVKLHNFLKKFNKVASNIDFTALGDTFFASVDWLCDFVKSWNIKFFRSFNIRIEILILQIPKEKYASQQNNITLLENSDLTSFEIFIKEIHTSKIIYSTYDVRFSLFVFNLTQDAFRLDDEKISLMKDEEDSIIWTKNAKNSFESQSELYELKDELKKKNMEENNIKYPLLDLNKNLTPSRKKQEMKVLKFLRRFWYFFLYLFMTHKKARFGSRTTYIFICLLMVFDSFVFVVLSINVALQYKEDIINFVAPFPGVIALAPIIGCFWISSQSYLLGKLFLVFNFMALLNCFLNLMVSTNDIHNGFSQYSLKVTTLFFKILLAYFGSSLLPHLKKHNY